MSGSSTNVYTPINSSYQLVFDDEFDGTSLNTNSWNVGWYPGSNGLSPPVNSAEQGDYGPSEVSVSGGYLNLSAVATQSTANGKTYNYQSGLIHSPGYSYTYGYYEARIYLPPASSGVIANWPAWWMDGQAWPADGEIDTMEGLSGGASSTFHNSSGAQGEQASGNYTGWHVYGVLWTPGELQFYYDGNLVHTVTSGVTSSPMQLILDYAVGGYGGPITTPDTMLVDYVHAYQSTQYDPNLVAVTPQAGYGGPGADGSATPTPTPVAPTITAVTPQAVGSGKTTEIAKVSPGTAGDTLTVTENSATFGGELAIQSVNGVEEVIFAAPATIAANETDAIAYTINDTTNGTSATGSASIGLTVPPPPPPTTTPSPNGTEITSASASPIIDDNGNAWSLVQPGSQGLQIAINGTIDAVTHSVVLLEKLNGAMVQENSGGQWYSETQPNDSWVQISNPNPPPPPPAPATVVTGNGSDMLVLSISEDAYANGDGTSDPSGDAALTVSVDGKQLAGTFYATASHSAGAGQNFTLKGDWAPGAHTVTVVFLNDAWGGTASTDRNLYVNDVTYDGTDTKQSAALMSTGSQTFSVTDRTAIPPVVTGGGSDSLVVKVSEDYYLANAQFTVSIDGKQLGGTFTATALHSSGNSQTFAFAGDFGAGQHTVSVKFLNDAWAGTAATDRNLYVNDIVYNGADTKQSAALMSTGAKTFSVSGGTTPSVSETGDHGSLQRNLSQTGSYTVGGDTFVLGSGNADTVTLGTGTSQIKFVGPSSVTLTGGAGQATVTADAGNNKFVTGSGSLDVTGGAGKDAYIFHATSGLLTVEDFSVANGGTLTVDKSLQSSLHEASDGKGGMMLTFGANQGVGLRGLASLPSSNIVWA